MAHQVKHPTSAQVMISRFVGSNPASGSALTVQSLLGILSLPLSLCLMLSFSLKISKLEKFFKFYLFLLHSMKSTIEVQEGQFNSFMWCFFS